MDLDDAIDGFKAFFIGIIFSTPILLVLYFNINTLSLEFILLGVWGVIAWMVVGSATMQTTKDKIIINELKMKLEKQIWYNEALLAEVKTQEINKEIKNESI